MELYENDDSFMPNPYYVQDIPDQSNRVIDDNINFFPNDYHDQIPTNHDKSENMDDAKQDRENKLFLSPDISNNQNHYLFKNQQRKNLDFDNDSRVVESVLPQIVIRNFVSLSLTADEFKKKFNKLVTGSDTKKIPKVGLLNIQNKLIELFDNPKLKFDKKTEKAIRSYSQYYFINFAPVAILILHHVSSLINKGVIKYEKGRIIIEDETVQQE